MPADHRWWDCHPVSAEFQNFLSALADLRPLTNGEQPRFEVLLAAAMKSLVTFWLLLFAVSRASLADVILSFSGSDNPVDSGWSATPAVPGLSAGSLVNDNGTGVDAWFVSDTSTAVGSFLGYSQDLTPSQLTSATDNGWTLRARLRVANDGDSVGNQGSVMVDFIDGTTQFGMAFGSELDGDPIVSLPDSNSDQFSGLSFTLDGGGNGYHLYELVYDPIASSADLFVNGVERISDYTGRGGTLNSVRFGALSSLDTGQGNYNLVQFELNPTAIPEPSSLILLLGLSLVGGLVRWRAGGVVSWRRRSE